MKRYTTERRVRSSYFLIAICAALAVFAASCANCAEQPQLLKISVTSPQLYEVVSFIGGRIAHVRALSKWGEGGRVYLAGSPRKGEIIIALDPSDAARCRVSAKNGNLRLIYEKSPMDEPSMRAAFFDPAMLPFIAQEVMKTLSALDSGNYSYYQRRLAEFQSRIDSAIGVGRHLIAGAGILDLTGAEGAWVRSSISGVIRPPDVVWDRWLSGDTAALRAALDEAARRGWLILLDAWTPDIIRETSSQYSSSLMLSPPENGNDYFAYLNDIFTEISRRVKPQPQQ